ncbi:MAG: ornithine cyclodeaminase family protein [Aureliella sp.]
MDSSGVLILKEEQVDELVGAADAIGALTEMLSSMAAGNVVNVPRRRAQAPGFVLHSLSAVDSRLGRAAWKQYTTTRSGARFHVGLYDVASGELLALVQANRLGQLRTGAMSAVAARRLAPPDGLGTVALIGCGWQAESQLECLAKIAPTSDFRVYCRNADRRAQFARRICERLQRQVTPADTAESCVRGARTLVTMTNAREPVVEEAWLDDCRLILAAGSNQPRNAELPASVVRRAVRIVVDDVEGCRNEAGDLIRAASELTNPESLWQRVESLASAMASDDEPMQSPQWTLFKSVGMAASDLAMASLIYDRACERDIGSRIEL